jgi:hypothetical protein
MSLEHESEWLVPELQDSDWYLDYVEVGEDEQPEERHYGYLIESYTFINHEAEISLACNIEESRKCIRSYQVYVDELGGGETIYFYQNRKNWWSGIRDLMSMNPNEVVDL